MANSENSWEIAVGQFMLAFGHVEHTTIALLCCLPECKIPKTAKSLPLATRINLLQEVLPRGDRPEYSEVLKTLSIVNVLVRRRNLVAHNTVWFDFYKDGDKVMFTQHLMSARDRKVRLNLEEMQKLAGDVKEASQNFTFAAVELMELFLDEEDL